MSVEIIAISAKSFSEAMTVVKHRCDAVETKPVEMEFLEPVFAVREEEVKHFVSSVVEA